MAVDVLIVNSFVVCWRVRCGCLRLTGGRVRYRAPRRDHLPHVHRAEDPRPLLMQLASKVGIFLGRGVVNGDYKPPSSGAHGLRQNKWSLCVSKVVGIHHPLNGAQPTD